jgi:hypothetical protein
VEAHNVLFAGSGIPELHPYLAQRALQILLRTDVPQFLSPQGQNALSSARRLTASMKLESQFIFEMNNQWILFLWTGSRAARTIQFALRREGYHADFPSYLFPWVLSIPRTDQANDLKKIFGEIARQDSPVSEIVESIPKLLLLEHKYDEYLPDSLLRSRAKEDLLDWEEAKQVIQRLAQ